MDAFEKMILDAFEIILSPDVWKTLWDSKFLRFLRERWSLLILSILSFVYGFFSTTLQLNSINLSQESKSDFLKQITLTWEMSQNGKIYLILSIIVFIFVIINFIFEYRGFSGIWNAKNELFEYKESISKAITASHYYILSQKLLDFASIYGFSENERISLYRHDKSHFYLIARHSENPHYNKVSRPQYPDDEGCIGDAWHNGDKFIDSAPDPTANLNRYLDFQEQHNMPKEQASQFRMKSRLLYARSIKDRRKQKFAVVVIESVRPNSLVKNSLSDALDSSAFKDIVELIYSLSDYAPKLEYAKEKGF